MSAPLRVAHLIHTLGRDAAGVQTACLGIALGLERAGHVTAAFGLGDAGDDPDAGRWPADGYRGFAGAGPHGFGHAPGLAAALEGFGADVVHQHGLWTAHSILGTRWGERHGHRRVISPQGMLEPWALAQKRAKKRVATALYEGRNLARAGCLHALTESEARDLGRAAPGVPVCVVPNGIELPPARPADAGPPAGSDPGRGSGSGPDDSPYLLFLSRVHDKKNVLGLVEAWARLEADPALARWRLVVAGWGEPADEAALRGDLERRGLARCEYRGAVFGDAKEALLAGAAGFVLPSFSEGLPLAVLEAMAHRVPAIVTDGCNVPEVFAEGAGLRTGTDPADIGDALRRFAALPGPERAAMGARARALVERRFTSDAVAASFVDVYAWLAGRAGPPDSLFDA